MKIVIYIYWIASIYCTQSSTIMEARYKSEDKKQIVQQLRSFNNHDEAFTQSKVNKTAITSTPTSLSSTSTSAQLIILNLSVGSSSIFMTLGTAGQQFEVNVNINSDKSWVYGSGCVVYGDNGVKYQTIDPSQTYECLMEKGCNETTNNPVSFSYTTFGLGNYYQDVLNGNKAQTQFSFVGDAQSSLITDIVLAKSLKGNINIGIHQQIGLGNPIQQSPIINSLRDSGVISDSSYSVYFEQPQQPGELTIGGYNPERLESDQFYLESYFPAAMQLDQIWTLIAQNVTFSNFSMTYVNIQIEFTNSTFFSADLYDSFTEYLKAQNFISSSSGIDLYGNCDVEFPSIGIQIKNTFGNTQDLKIPSKNFIRTSNCLLNIYKLQGNQKNLIILGYDFLAEYVSVFSYTNSTIGFQKSKQGSGDDNNSGLSTLAIVLISVGVSIVVICIIVAISYKLVQKKKLRDKQRVAFEEGQNCDEDQLNQQFIEYENNSASKFTNDNQQENILPSDLFSEQPNGVNNVIGQAKKLEQQNDNQSNLNNQLRTNNQFNNTVASQQDRGANNQGKQIINKIQNEKPSQLKANVVDPVEEQYSNNNKNDSNVIKINPQVLLGYVHNKNFNQQGFISGIQNDYVLYHQKKDCSHNNKNQNQEINVDTENHYIIYHFKKDCEHKQSLQ